MSDGGQRLDTQTIAFQRLFEATVLQQSPKKHCRLQFCEKFHQFDTNNCNKLLQNNQETYCLSTFRLHIHTSHYILTTGAGSQSWWRLPTWSRNFDKQYVSWLFWSNL